jgi:hypothetical protein
VSLVTVNIVTATLLILTDVAPVRPVPVIVTTVPAGPLAGVKLEIAGGGITVKIDALVAVPATVVTVIVPTPAPAGAVAVIWVSLVTVNVVAATPLKATAEAPDKLVPEIVTTVPAGPFAGVKLEITGGGITVKLPALVVVPAIVVTAIVPVPPPVGAVAEI